ncbi:MAG: hypothetical protein RLZZ387_325 [Chloroflexota bacterium]|jgi:Fur family ferric uptake transcriptional regulator
MARLLKRQEAVLPAEAHALVQQLIAAGYKVTRPRLAVLAAAVEQGSSFTAADIERRLAEQGESPGEASIFRTLKLLTDLGLMQRIHGVDDCHRYALSSGHAHRIVCTSCGRLVEFADCAIEELAARLERATGYRIRSHLLEFFGSCPHCLAAS